MIAIKNKLTIQKMQAAGFELSQVFEMIPSLLHEEMTTLELNNVLESELRKRNLVSQTKGYKSYKHATCISVNEEVVHGVPGSRVIRNGDLIKVDICVALKGYCADMARCFFVGKDIDSDLRKFVDVAKKSLDLGIQAAIPGNRLTDISFAIQQEVEKHGFGVVRDFAGHGIGKRMHEEPQILNYGNPGEGPVLREGMTFAIEPMITQGDYRVVVKSDGWTAVTKDSSFAAHVEDTIAITSSGPKILTRLG